MRAALWSLCLTACGRIGFDARSDAPLSLADVVAQLPFVIGDPIALGPFGTPQLVAELSLPGVDDDDPALSRDQLEMFFDRGSNDLYTSRRASITDPWAPPTPLVELNTGATEEHPNLSADGLRLYFTSGRGGDANLYVAFRSDRDAPWGNLTAISEINTAEYDALGGVSSDELVLVLSSTRGSMTTDDLYEVQRGSPSEPWGTAVALGDLNTPAYERGAHLDDFGVVMYYDRTVMTGLWWTRRADTASAWEAPISVDELAVANESESDPWLSPDLRTIYFVRGTSDPGSRDIYTATR